MKSDTTTVAFTGGGTAGHIYPGLAVADELRGIFSRNGRPVRIIWIGASHGMDGKIVGSTAGAEGIPSADVFYGIPSGKLRRYFSFKNFTDVFRIAGGFFRSLYVLSKERPAALFSKGGFVSVPPCLAARILGIPVYTHECDFTLGLANRINLKSAGTLFVSYQETKDSVSAPGKNVVLSGNPVRPVFYSASAERGFEFLGLPAEKRDRPVLLVLGGSSGSRQINSLVTGSLAWLCRNFIVVHQTGIVNTDPEAAAASAGKFGDSYRSYPFIYSRMADVLACCDVVLSRAGANSVWESAVLRKPMVLVPLSGGGTRGDQVENAGYFKRHGAAEVLAGDDVSPEGLKAALGRLCDPSVRDRMAENLRLLTGDRKPALAIAEYIYRNLPEEK